MFIATNGGLLPDDINDDEGLLEMKDWIDTLPDLDKDNQVIYIHDDYVHDRLAEQDLSARKSYLYTFRRMARKGFYAFDRDIRSQNEECYRLVAWPKYYLRDEASMRNLKKIKVNQLEKKEELILGFCLMM